MNLVTAQNVRINAQSVRQVSFAETCFFDIAALCMARTICLPQRKAGEPLGVTQCPKITGPRTVTSPAVGQ